MILSLDEKLCNKKSTPGYFISGSWKIYEWFYIKRDQTFILSGENIKLAALRIAKKLYIKNFKASNGWLESF